MSSNPKKGDIYLCSRDKITLVVIGLFDKSQNHVGILCRPWRFYTLFHYSRCPAKFDQFSAKFVSGYQSLHLPALELSYVNGLQAYQLRRKHSEAGGQVGKSELATLKADELIPIELLPVTLLIGLYNS